MGQVADVTITDMKERYRAGVLRYRQMGYSEPAPGQRPELGPSFEVARQDGPGCNIRYTLRSQSTSPAPSAEPAH